MRFWITVVSRRAFSSILSTIHLFNQLSFVFLGAAKHLYNRISPSIHPPPICLGSKCGDCSKTDHIQNPGLYSRLHILMNPFLGLLIIHLCVRLSVRSSVFSMRISILASQLELPRDKTSILLYTITIMSMTMRTRTMNTSAARKVLSTTTMMTTTTKTMITITTFMITMTSQPWQWQWTTMKMEWWHWQWNGDNDDNDCVDDDTDYGAVTLTTAMTMLSPQLWRRQQRQHDKAGDTDGDDDNSSGDITYAPVDIVLDEMELIHFSQKRTDVQALKDDLQKSSNGSIGEQWTLFSAKTKEGNSEGSSLLRRCKEVR